MTTQKMEGVEIGDWTGVEEEGKGRSTNMIIASIFAFFYFCLCPDARNHRQSVLDSPPFFMFLCFAVFLICFWLFLPSSRHILYFTKQCSGVFSSWLKNSTEEQWPVSNIHTVI